MPDLPWFVYAILLAPLGLLLVAAAYKSLQVRAAREWPSAPGKVMISKAEVRDVEVLDSSREDRRRIEQRNFANIVYEYAARGETLRNNRVSIGEDRGNFEVAETLARYPVGKAVTVYYNPAHPHEAVLERDLPKGLWGCLGIATAIVLAIVFGSAIGLHQLTEFLTSHVADPKLSPLVVAFGGFGCAVALFALALQRQSSLAKKWPVVTGVIKRSEIESYRAAPSESGSRGSMMYERKISYTYTYQGVSYTNVHASFSGNVASTSSWLVGKFTTDWRNGAAVKVYVNPVNPADATLRPGVPFVWLLWLCVAGFAAGAWHFATVG